MRKTEVKKACMGMEPDIQLSSPRQALAGSGRNWNPATSLNVADKVEVIGEVTGNKCESCHHTYDEAQKKLIYKKDTENSCRACHKAKDEKNARSMKKVAHSACIGCHMKLCGKGQKGTGSTR